MIELRTLGTLDLSHSDGRDVSSVLHRRKRLALLIYVALARPRGFHSRDTLVALFWPELDQAHARNALRQALHYLRRALGKEPIVARGEEELRIDEEQLWCDAVAFEKALRSGEPETALRLYGGDFLTGFHVSAAPEFERWLDEERERLRREAAAAALELADREESIGNLVGAAAWARRALEISPYDETLERYLLETLDRAGDRAGAVRTYEEFERRLAHDLEVGPSPETKDLVEQVRTRRELGHGHRPSPARALRSANGLPSGSARPDGLRALIRGGRFIRLPILAGVIGFSLLLTFAGYHVVARKGSEVAPLRGETSAAPSAPRIAVLPFRVVGPDLQLWREGLVDLLSGNLDGVAGLQKVEPRALLSQWHREIDESEESADPSAVLNVARGLGARYAIAGSLIGTGDEIRLSADVYDLAANRRVGSAEVRGPSDSILGLVDRLTLAMIRSGLGATAGEGLALSVGRLASNSLPATKAYLEGEQAFRADRLRDARQAYERAVEADSSFAFALYRLAMTYSMGDPANILVANIPTAAGYIRRALHFSHNLPERERLLLTALERVYVARSQSELDWLERPGYRPFSNHRQAERLVGQAAAIPILHTLTIRYPNDPEGWFHLGDALWHTGPLAFHPAERNREAFRRALELDPTVAGWYNHPILDAIARADSAEARRMFTRLDEAYGRPAPDPSSSRWRETWATSGPRHRGLALTLIWGDSASRARIIASLDTTPSEVLLLAAGVHLRGGPEFWAECERLLRLVTSREHSTLQARLQAQWFLAALYLRHGRPARAWDALQDLLETRIRAGLAGDRMAATARAALYLRVSGFNAGPVPAGTLAVLASRPVPEDGFFLGANAALDGRWAEAEAHIEALERMAREVEAEGDTTRALDHRSLVNALRIYVGIRRGDLDAALRTLDAPMPRLYESVHDILRYEVGVALLERGRYQEADRYFQTFYRSWPFLARAEFYLGQVHEALGNDERARLHYARFVRWWSGSDPEFRPLWEKGRKAMERLSPKPEPEALRPNPLRSRARRAIGSVLATGTAQASVGRRRRA